MADAPPRRSPDLSNITRIPLGGTLASIAAGQRTVDWLVAFAILRSRSFMLPVDLAERTAPGARAACAIPDREAFARLAAHERDMAFATALMGFDVGMTWFLRFSEALRPGLSAADLRPHATGIGASTPGHPGVTA